LKTSTEKRLKERIPALSFHRLVERLDRSEKNIHDPVCNLKTIHIPDLHQINKKDDKMDIMRYLMIAWVLFFGFGLTDPSHAFTKGGIDMDLKSASFENGGMIPARYTCDGKNVSPALEWHSVPASTKSIAIIADDPDAPMGTWVHWVYYNIPPETTSLPENVPLQDHPYSGGIQGTNDFGKTGYGGPCPPGGTHRYYFKIYALDAMLDLGPGATKKQILKAMEGHILDQARLMGKYKRR
jgi:Raf kinase inhibitor-like YbhB/YbcL family protein